ncbi:MAG: carboxylic ester hydrolase [Anaerolineales bacterium]
MRPLEIILTLLLAARLAWPWFAPASAWMHRLALLGVAAAILQLTVEKYRWQLLPLYLLALLLGILALFALRSGNPPPRLPWTLLGGLLLIAGAALAALLPVPTLPKPTGPYAIGTRIVELRDPARSMQYGPQPDAPRRFMVQVWYPATEIPAGAQPAPWMPHVDLLGPAIAQWLGLPSFALDHLNLSRTHAYTDAPPAEGPFPVLLFSHGWGGFRAQNTFQMEELASHGYVVIGFDHTYGAVGVVFPDGTLAAHDPEALPGDARDTRLVQQWADDMRFVLDQLGKGALDGLPVDLGRVGVLGHSTGGGAAVEFCHAEPRCAAVLGMDTYMSPVSDVARTEGFAAPYLAMFSQAWPKEKNNRLFAELRTALSGPLYEVHIQGTAHYDFTDLPAFSPLAPRIGLKGPLNGARVQEIVRAYSVAFFDQVFKGQPSPLLDGPSPRYPEVQWRP